MSPARETPASPAPVRDPTWIQGPAADLAVRVCFDGLRPAPPVFTPVVGGSIDGEEVRPSASSAFAIEDGDLHVRFDDAAGRVSRLVSLNSLRRQPMQPAHLKLQDGMEISAGIGVMTGTGTSLSVDDPPKHSWEARLYDWTAQRALPPLWVGVTAHDFMWHAQGNLLVQGGARGSGLIPSSVANLRLDGSYTWSVIGSREDTVLVIDTGGRSLDHRLLVADFCALELTFGTRLGVPWLAGVDETGTPVAWTSVSGLGGDVRDRNPRTDPPVPVHNRARTACWAAPFFTAVARALATDTEMPWVARNAYLDSINEHLDGAYLKLQVALEAMCHEVKRSAPPLLVSDMKAWLRWVEEHAHEVATLASNREAAEKLLGKIRTAMNPPATDAVEDALGALGLRPSPQVMEEIRHRNRAVHRYLMSSKGRERDLLDDWDRVRKLRTVLLAVYAKQIGYTGPISGWEVDALGHGVPAPWWPHGDCDGTRWFAYGRAQGTEGAS